MKILSSLLHRISNIRHKKHDEKNLTYSPIGMDNCAATTLSYYDYADYLCPKFDIQVAPVFKVESQIAPILSNCKYGKQNLFSDLDSLNVYRENGQLYISGFYCPEDKDGEITGICEELTQKVGEKIARMFKDEYSAIALFVSGTKYGFQNHACVGMVKRNKENDEIIAAIEEVGELSRKIQEYSRLGKDTTELQKLFDERNKENLAKMSECDFWKDAILVDPSLNFVSELYKLPEDYKLTGFNSLEGNNPFREGATELTDKLKTPLGIAKDIFPEITDMEEFSPEAIVSFRLSADDNSKLVVFVKDLGDKKGQAFSLEDLKDEFPESNLCKFVERIESQLKEV